MRIRKRQIPLPLSSLSPNPISDPHFNRSPPVVQLHHHHGHDPHQNLSPQQDDASCGQPSDHPNQSIRSGSSSLDQKDKDCLVLLEDEEKSNDSRNNNILGEEIAAAGVLSQLSSSHPVVGRWCEGEKAFPLKKRRRKNDEEEEIMMEEKDNNNNNKKMKTKMKNQMKKKFNNDNNEHEEQSDGRVDNNNNGSKKRGSRGGAIMEGSRCSRVNGRGWRCCQQTLVGYSLCEHHLGKGRMRSMNSVRSRSSLGSSAPSSKGTDDDDAKLALLSGSSSSSTLQEISKMKQELLSNEADNDEDDEEKPLVIAKKRRMKLGTVKARSISSLLGQKDNEIVAAD